MREKPPHHVEEGIVVAWRVEQLSDSSVSSFAEIGDKP